jgi:hypothetical protein
MIYVCLCLSLDDKMVMKDELERPSKRLWSILS